MRYPKDQKAQTRQKIVAEAGKLFRSRGYSAVGVDAVMGAAGLTAGGFYAHFPSKEALFAETLDQAILERLIPAQPPPDEPPAARLATLINSYLSEEHLDSPEQGCPLPCLGGEVPRQSSTLRAAFTQALTRRLEKFAALMPGADAEQRRANAFELLSCMAGAVLMARAMDDRPLALSLLASTRASLLQRWVHSKRGSANQPKAWPKSGSSRSPKPPRAKSPGK